MALAASRGAKTRVGDEEGRIVCSIRQSLNSIGCARRDRESDGEDMPEPSRLPQSGNRLMSGIGAEPTYEEGELAATSDSIIEVLRRLMI